MKQEGSRGLFGSSTISFAGSSGQLLLQKTAPPRKFNEPGPVRVHVVVSSQVKADPAATMFPVAFERSMLLRHLREVVEPKDR